MNSGFPAVVGINIDVDTGKPISCLTEAEEARNSGIARTWNANEQWRADAKAAFDLWLSDKPEGFEFIAEDFRQAAKTLGLKNPGHPNAWGAFTRAHFTRKSGVKVTDQMRVTKDLPSHARPTRVYVWKRPQ